MILDWVGRIVEVEEETLVSYVYAFWEPALSFQDNSSDLEDTGPSSRRVCVAEGWFPMGLY